MNERIKELAKEAGLNLIHDNFMTASQEKFAELIVQECIDIAKDVNRNPYLPDEDQARQIIKNITKRFGVTR